MKKVAQMSKDLQDILYFARLFLLSKTITPMISTKVAMLFCVLVFPIPSSMFSLALLIIICSLKSVGGENTSDSFAANASSKQVLQKHSWR